MSSLFSLFPDDVIRHILTFLIFERSGWCRSVTLPSIRNAGGLETVILYKCPPLEVLNCLLGERTRSLIIQSRTSLKTIFDNLSAFSLENLERLLIGYSTYIQDMEPLREFSNLKILRLNGCSTVTSLEPLRKMRLEILELWDFPKVTSLEPLRGMRPKSLKLWNFINVTSLESLQDMRPKVLEFWYFISVTSLEPLREMRPETLVLFNFGILTSFEPLRGMRPKHLFLDSFEKMPFIEIRSIMCGQSH